MINCIFIINNKYFLKNTSSENIVYILPIQSKQKYT